MTLYKSEANLYFNVGHTGVHNDLFYTTEHIFQLSKTNICKSIRSICKQEITLCMSRSFRALHSKLLFKTAYVKILCSTFYCENKKYR